MKTPNDPAEIILPLTSEEKARLAELENTITQNQFGFVETGKSLAEIIAAKLHRGIGTFPEYLKAKFPTMHKMYGKGGQLYHIAQAAQVVAKIEDFYTNGIKPDVPLPENERQTRPLAPLLKTEPEAIPALWNEAVSRAEGTVPPARIVQEVVDEHKETVRQQWENVIHSNDDAQGLAFEPSYKHAPYETPVIATERHGQREYDGDGVNTKPTEERLPKSFAYIEPATIGRDNRIGGFRFTVIRPPFAKGGKETKIPALLFRDAWFEALGYRLVRIADSQEDDAFACIESAPSVEQQRTDAVDQFFADE